MPAWMEGESPGTPMVRAEARGARERRRRRKENVQYLCMGHSLFGMSAWSRREDNFYQDISALAFVKNNKEKYGVIGNANAVFLLTTGNP